MIPAWVRYPGEEWETLTPAAAGLDEAAFWEWANSQDPEFGKFGNRFDTGCDPAEGGIVITRGGCIVHT